MNGPLLHDPGGRSRPPWPTGAMVTPLFSACERYRYALSEIWDRSKPLVMWLLMNPSVACTDYSDPTLRKTGIFSRAWGFGGQLIGNVHAYRATDKMRLLEVDDPVGPENDRHLLEMASRAEKVILAFGNPPKQLQPRGQQVIELLRARSKLFYLRLLKDGVTPEHPLYLPADLKLKPYPVGGKPVTSRRTTQ